MIRNSMLCHVSHCNFYLMSNTSYHLSIILVSFILLSFIPSVKSQQWQNVSPDPHNLISTGSFINENEGWLFTQSAYTNNYILLHTINGAKTFDSIYSTPFNRVCWRLQMMDSLNGFAKFQSIAGSGDNFLRTNDGGHSWMDITDTSLFNVGGPLFTCEGFYFINKLKGFFGGDNCIYKTEDGGLSWLKMNTPTFIDSTSSNYRINSIFFLNNKFGWATCSLFLDLGIGMKTIDGGENWTVCTPVTGNLYGVHFSDSLKGGMVGGDSFGFAFWPIVLGTNDNFNSISYDYSNSSIPPWDQFPLAIRYQNDSTIWISGFPALLNKSINNGLTFMDYDSAFASNINALIFDIQFFGTTGYSIGNTFLLKLVDTLNTAVHYSRTIVNDIRVSPNPASEILKVNVGAAKGGLTAIEIYSMDGRRVDRSENYLYTGQNEISLDVKKLNPGIYILSMNHSSGNFKVKFIKQ
jgi:photosystem II stability/assembly factor-like uncharacterized protein